MVMEILTRYQSSVLLMLQKILAAIVICLYFTACTKDATVKLPDTAPKPVLVCFVSPEDPFIRVKLTNSVPLYSSSTKNYPFDIKDAEVMISNGITSAQVPWYKDSVGYLLSTSLFSIKPGTSYTLQVKIPDGRVLSAVTTVPVEDFPAIDFSLIRQTVDSGDFGISFSFDYTMKWKDVAGSKNYYRGVIYNLYADSSLGADTTVQQSTEFFETDEGRDGGEIRLNGQGYLFYSPSSPIPAIGSNFIGYLMLGNRDYYLYHKDLFLDMGDNPFSEAKINFSNIAGGIGCFGAYRMAKKRF